MTNTLIAMGIGLAAGILGGFFGVGGGVLVVPALIFMLHMSQHTAIGTSLGALLPPVGLLGAWEYYKHGAINVPFALLIGFGMIIGAYFGAIFAVRLSGVVLRRAFAFFLMAIAVRMLWD